MTRTWKMAGKGIYLDTSGVLAFLDSGDTFHSEAVRAWEAALEDEVEMWMTDYVRLECWSLIQRRLGIEAVEDFLHQILPRCRVEAVGEAEFSLLARQVLSGRRRELSLVDLSSFESMRRNGIKEAIAFDRHFNEQGFLTPK
jgi:predicted nucleic acid-binding protein